MVPSLAGHPGLPHLLRPMMAVDVSAVVVRSDALKTLQSELVECRDGLETGGILLGAITDGNAEVRLAGGPGPAAVRHPNFFMRDLGYAQQLADIAYATDQSVWIGDWHSHLNDSPIPSRRDMNTYHHLLQDQELGFTVFISIIAALGSTVPAIAAWVCRLDGARRVPLLYRGRTVDDLENVLRPEGTVLAEPNDDNIGIEHRDCTVPKDQA